MMRKIVKLRLFLVSFLFLFFSLTGPLFPQTYPLPLDELHRTLMRWLEQHGFEVTKAPSETGIELKASKGMQRCSLRLITASPLASSLSVACFDDAELDSDLEKRLHEWIAGYVSGQDAQEPVKEGDPFAPTIPSIVLSKIESVVCLKGQLKDREAQFSGFLVDQDGLILSTAHDVRELKDLVVVLHDGRHLKGTLVKIDPLRDLALVDVEGRFPAFISVADSRNLLGIGEPIFSVGCPVNLGGTVYPGLVNGPPRLVNDLPLWQVNMEIHPGSSGSPVFDMEGHLVAIVKGRLRGTDTIGFLIPLETIVDFAQEGARR